MMLMPAVLALVCAACKEQPVAPEVLRPVRFEAVYATGGERVRAFSGVAQAGVESRLSFKVNGTVRNLNVKLGDKVQSGALIAELDPSDFEVQVDRAEASLVSAEAEMRSAIANYDRVRQLFENANASRNDLDAARARSESARAQVRSLEKQLEGARLQLSYTRITAPLAGAIASVDVERNENVGAGQTIVQLSSGVQMEVQVAIPEILISQLRTGQRVEVSFDAMPERTFSARITEVGISPDRAGATFPVKVRLEEQHDDVRPGMAAQVGFVFGQGSSRPRFLVPPFAVRGDSAGTFVFVVEPAEAESEGLIHRREVAVGELRDDGLEVFTGLQDGDRVVTAGVSQLRDGQRVKFQEEGP